MSPTYAPIQMSNLFKSVMIIFVLQAIVVLFAPFFAEPIVRFSILVVNIIISLVLGWRLYKTLYHTVLSYDEQGFTLRKGRKDVNSHKWNEFSKVSLFRTESGELSVRLYRNSEYFDLPASRLKLNPFNFRHEITRLVSDSKGKK